MDHNIKERVWRSYLSGVSTNELQKSGAHSNKTALPKIWPFYIIIDTTKPADLSDL